MPRRLALFGLVGEPLIILMGTLAMFGVIERSGSVMGLATVPEIVWEGALALYPLIWGFRASSPLLAPGRNAYASLEAMLERVVGLPDLVDHAGASGPGA